MKDSRFSLFPEGIKHIGVIAPAGPIREEEALRNIDILRKSGVKVSLSKHLFSKDKDMPFLSASDKIRVEELHSFWRDKSIDMIIPARGGYGCIRILPFIDWPLLCSRDVIFCGFSDISALLLAMYKKGVKYPVSGPMIVHIEKLLRDKASLHAYKKMLSLLQSCKKENLIVIDSRFRQFYNIKQIAKGKAEGPVLPVNLSLLVSLIGSDFLPDLSEHILILEDINEAPYKIDKMLNQLILSGIASKIAGVIFGRFINCGDDILIEKVFGNFANYIQGPVLINFPFAHAFPFLTIPLGTRCIII